MTYSRKLFFCLIPSTTPLMRIDVVFSKFDIDQSISWLLIIDFSVFFCLWPVTKNNLTNTWRILANFFFVWHPLPPHWCASMSFFRIWYRSIDIVIIDYRFFRFFACDLWPRITYRRLDVFWQTFFLFKLACHPIDAHLLRFSKFGIDRSMYWLLIIDFSDFLKICQI